MSQLVTIMALCVTKVRLCYRKKGQDIYTIYYNVCLTYVDLIIIMTSNSTGFTCYIGYI